jgi:hypothetical protein
VFLLVCVVQDIVKICEFSKFKICKNTIFMILGHIYGIPHNFRHFYRGPFSMIFGMRF